MLAFPSRKGAGNGTQELMGTSQGKVLLNSEAPPVKPAPEDSPGKWPRGTEQSSCDCPAAPATLPGHPALWVGALGLEEAITSKRELLESGEKIRAGRTLQRSLRPLCVTEDGFISTKFSYYKIICRKKQLIQLMVFSHECEKAAVWLGISSYIF